MQPSLSALFNSLSVKRVEKHCDTPNLVDIRHDQLNPTGPNIRSITADQQAVAAACKRVPITLKPKTLAAGEFNFHMGAMRLDPTSVVSITCALKLSKINRSRTPA